MAQRSDEEREEWAAAQEGDLHAAGRGGGGEVESGGIGDGFGVVFSVAEHALEGMAGEPDEVAAGVHVEREDERMTERKMKKAGVAMRVERERLLDREDGGGGFKRGLGLGWRSG
ncbi:eukaryotic aspartyl protease family protein [Actinidia rufa]|uniref:Eukaryotic aspartyl protease family protein n=1 Tax=Actinidia rufa TaxID=165716 RepID=A0A7J0FR63_9ERIC|nr:eukaryotic aspartyl protease family protein [Actinidia rufa]